MPMDQLKYSMQYKYVPNSRMNSIRIIFDIKTTPSFINEMKCACTSESQDKNPYDTAIAAALLLTLEENIIVFKANKNQSIEMHYMNTGGEMTITFSLPVSLASVKQAMNIVKKSINNKLGKRAYKLLIAAFPQFKKDKDQAIDTIAARINKPASITVFGKVADSGKTKKRVDQLLSKLKEMQGTKLDSGKKAVDHVTQHVDLDQYNEVHLPGSVPQSFVAILCTAMQLAGFDFFTDGNMKKIYVHRTFCSGSHLTPIKQFLKARLRFIFNKDTLKNQELTDKKLNTLASLIYQQSAIPIDLSGQLQQLTKSQGAITNVMDDFANSFKK